MCIFREKNINEKKHCLLPKKLLKTKFCQQLQCGGGRGLAYSYLMQCLLFYQKQKNHCLFKKKMVENEIFSTVTAWWS